MKNTVLRTQFILAALLMVLRIGTAFAQAPGTGAISGLVLDPGERVVGNAEVLVVSEQTHASRSVKTDAAGVFHVTLLPPGKYTATVHAPGFSVERSQPIDVTVSQTSSLDVKLTVAQTKTTVEVSGAASVANLESSTLGGLVDDTAIQALPLSNRNFTQILALAPGVVTDLPVPSSLGRGTINVAITGSTPTQNNIQFNGIDANNMAEDSASNAESSIVGVAVPAPDTIQEFRVQTANFDAAYGRSPGGNVDLVSKSGSNVFHGSAWEFVRNNIFNANDFFSKLDNQPRADLKHNQFGGSAGGPIWRDKTFFFVAYQGLTEVNGLGDETQSTLPLLTQDRSAATLGAQFCPAGHLDSAGLPATGYFTQALGVQVACNGSNINPVALAVLNAKLPSGQFAVPSPQMAIPNSGADPSDQFPVGQSTFTIPASYFENQFTVSIDQALSAKNLLSGRFFYSRATTATPFSPNGAANLPGWGTNELNRNTMFVLADTHNFKSSVVNVARFGYMRFDGLSEVDNPLTAQAIGITTPTGATGATLNAPGMSIGGFTIGDAGTPSEWQVTNTFVWQDTVAVTRGRQNTRFGIEFKQNEVDINSPNETDGLLQIPSFEDFLVGQSATENGSPEGLSNVGTTQSGGGIFRRNERYADFATFAQDDIKLMPRLTANVGVRYEIFGAPTETDGRIANFDKILATGPTPAAGTFSGYTVPSNFQAPIPAGVVQTPYAGLWRTPHGDISPRLGVSWQMTEKPVLVFHAGYGWYFDQHSGGPLESGLSQPPYATSNIALGAANGGATLQDPYVTPILPQSSYPIFLPRSAAAPLPFVQGTDPNLKDARTQEYNLNVQYAFAQNYLLEAGYVGTQSIHRLGQIGFNQSLLASPQNPVNGQTTNSVNNVTERQFYQGVPEGSLFSQSSFIGNYNSLQTSITRRFRHGFQIQASYVWSKNLDELGGEGGNDVFESQLPSNNQNDVRQSSYGLGGDDRDQRVVANFVWSVPKFSSAPTLARHLLTNWEFSGIGVIQSGAALSIFDGNAGSVYGGFSNRAESTGVNPSTHGSLFSRVVGAGRYLNGAAFEPAPEVPNGTSLADQDFGNSGVGIVRGPGQHNMDMAVERVFPVWRESSLRFRAEVFNLTNTPQFGNPNTGVGFAVPQPGVQDTVSSTFGQISAEQDGPHPRIIQFAAKYLF
jgi:Carboxypeptidase regulatory-like domain/TonB dependent receptor